MTSGRLPCHNGCNRAEKQGAEGYDYRNIRIREIPKKIFRNPLTSSQLPSDSGFTAAENNSTTEEKQMSHKSSTEVTAQVATSKSPIFLAAQESETLDIIEDLLLNLPHDTSLTDDLILTIQAYIASEGKDGNKSHDELGQLARKAKLWGVFKLCGQVKGSDTFQALVAKHTPEIIVSGGNQMGTVVSVGTTAKEVVEAPKPSKGGKKSTKAPKAKKEKVAKTKPVLPLPTIADISALEALDRKGLQQAIMAVNSQGITTGVNGKSSSEAIKIALAKELLGVEGYLPPTVTKEAKAAKGKAPESPLPMPEGLSWDEVKGMKFRQLQSLCKVFRSNGLFSGNIGGKGATKEALLQGAADAMRKLGHDIQVVQVSAPTDLKPSLEREGARGSLIEKANQGLATQAALGIAPDWNAVMAA